mgnify:CR=1 FL=1
MPTKTFSVIADWSTLGYVDAEYKARFPVTAGGFLSRKVTRKDDSPVNDPDVFYKSRKDTLAHIVLETGRFYMKMS